VRYTDTPPPDPATPWREADFCVVDLETTGLDPAEHEIISFAAIPVVGGQVLQGDVRYRLVRPQRMPGGETIVIHGLREAELAGAPPLADTLDELLEVLAGRVLVAHVSTVEEGFLRAALREHDVHLSNPIVDTAAMAAELFWRRDRVVLRPMGLTPLARELGLPVHRPHQADGDALTTAQVFLALATQLDAFSPQTVGSLEGLRRPPAWRQAWRRLRGGSPS
jgi:DNA polymerase III subunit epsilon